MYKQFKWTKISLNRNKLTKSYEPVQPFFFSALAKQLEAEIIFDVGANIGVYSIFSAATCPNAAIKAFEPAPDTFAELSENIEMNRLDNVVSTHQLAISDKSGSVNFGIVYGTSGANSIQSTSIHPDEKFVSHQMVQTIPLDSLVQEAGKIVFMKVDVEGHENNVLLGAQKLLECNHILLQIEDYDTLDTEYLKNLGFEHLLALGPDNYFTNHKSAFPEKLLLDVLQGAIGSSIAENLLSESPSDNLRQSNAPELPLDIPIAFGVSLRITGEVARGLRKIKRSIKSSKS